MKVTKWFSEYGRNSRDISEKQPSNRTCPMCLPSARSRRGVDVLTSSCMILSTSNDSQLLTAPEQCHEITQSIQRKYVCSRPSSNQFFVAYSSSTRALNMQRRYMLDNFTFKPVCMIVLRQIEQAMLHGCRHAARSKAFPQTQDHVGYVRPGPGSCAHAAAQEANASTSAGPAICTTAAALT